MHYLNSTLATRAFYLKHKNALNLKTTIPNELFSVLSLIRTSIRDVSTNVHKQAQPPFLTKKRFSVKTNTVTDNFLQLRTNNDDEYVKRALHPQYHKALHDVSIRPYPTYLQRKKIQN